MWKVIARRLALAIPLLLVVLTATFLLQQLIPGDPAAFVLGSSSTADQRTQLDASFGLHRPLPAQYFSTFGHALKGDLGKSWTSGESVAHAVATALPVTLSLAVLATLLTFVLGTALGMLAAVRQGGRVDRAVQLAAATASAIPGFWVAIGLVFLFAIKAGAFPATGYVPLSQSPGLWLHSLVLPVVALALAPLGPVVLQARSAMVDVLGRDYIRSLRALGLPPWRIVLKHALRNAAAPVVTTMGFNLIGLLAGTVLIEQVFSLPGLGSVLLTGVLGHDVPVVQGVVVFFAVAVVVVNLAVDLLVALLNPKARQA
ncbi:ABC transporter permease [Catenulispora rubra]|uniref:ABC transporter permease n=1 Tax=Catenulispora rubra TaxID=280293 RepID=UPI0018928196|nr:ABC transporter permease [Catenulispora rubra]